MNQNVIRMRSPKTEQGPGGDVRACCSRRAPRGWKTMAQKPNALHAAPSQRQRIWPFVSAVWPTHKCTRLHQTNGNGWPGWLWGWGWNPVGAPTATAACVSRPHAAAPVRTSILTEEVEVEEVGLEEVGVRGGGEHQTLSFCRLP